MRICGLERSWGIERSSFSPWERSLLKFVAYACRHRWGDWHGNLSLAFCSTSFLFTLTLVNYFLPHCHWIFSSNWQDCSLPALLFSSSSVHFRDKEPFVQFHYWRHSTEHTSAVFLKIKTLFLGSTSFSCFSLSKCLTNFLRCMCLKGFRWDPYSKQCIEHNLCLESDADGYPCFRPGTARCLYSPQQPNTPTHSCSCFDRFMGQTCNNVRDPCIQRHNRKLPAGRDACRSRQGGRCISRMGSDYYSCRCPNGWGHHSQLNFPNCFKWVQSSMTIQRCR